MFGTRQSAPRIQRLRATGEQQSSLTIGAMQEEVEVLCLTPVEDAECKPLRRRQELYIRTFRSGLCLEWAGLGLDGERGMPRIRAGRSFPRSNILF